MVCNCGHWEHGIDYQFDRRGYSWCRSCFHLEQWNSLGYSNRAELNLETNSYSFTVRTALSKLAGTITELVTNDGARTPTNGKYRSVKMTIVDVWGCKWYANGPKSGSSRIILRKADA